MRTLLKKLLRFVGSILVLAGIAAGGYFGFRAVSAAREAHAEKAPDNAERAPVPVRIEPSNAEPLSRRSTLSAPCCPTPNASPH